MEIVDVIWEPKVDDIGDYMFIFDNSRVISEYKRIVMMV